MFIPADVEEILSRLNAKGFEAYVVGGCVRDSIMGKLPVDWDVTTIALPEEVKGIFPHSYDTGIAHGTVTVVMNKRNYEVTTYRMDGEYLDNRHPSRVFFTRSVEEDLLRRDFTMNAICYHRDTGYLDPYGGVADIDAKIIRGVGDPSRRFEDDGLRMLRAIRFAAQLGFEIEEQTWLALVAKAELIKNISLERIRDEFLKLLVSERPGRISLLTKSGLMKHIDLGLAERIESLYPESLEMKALERTAKDACLRLVVLLRGCGGVRERLKFFKMDNKSIGLVSTLLAEAESPIVDDFTHIRRRLSKIGPEVFLKLIQVFEAYGQDLNGVRKKLGVILTQGQCISLSELALDGNDLKGMGITNGMEIGRLLKALFEHVLERPEDNSPEILRLYIERMTPR